MAKAAIPRAVKPPELPESLSFLSYCWRSYTETHTSLPWLFGMILGGILIAALSFSKPSIGTQLILGSFLLMALIAFLSFAVLSSVACVNYLFRRQRHVPDDRTTWLSATACFSLTLSLALAICSVAEFFGPSKGILVTLVPQLENEQSRIFPDTTIEQPETETLASNSGDHDVTDSVAEDSSDSTDVEASELSESEPVRASEPASTREMSADSDNEPSPKRNTPDSSPVVAQVGDEVQSTSRSDQPKTSKPADSNSTAETQEIIAEGVGATSDEAIKDAYRNAVRQVVGAVVDAETLVENDELIDDNVLTYSDGFIKTYEEVSGSKKVQGGLHRIKIKAKVERRSVIAKLKAANVTMKEVDGKGLFAEAVTQLDAEKDAAALLQKQFEGFPQSCIAATIIGEPEIVEKSTEEVKVKFTVKIEPDLKAYEAFADKLIPVLDKLAKDKGEFTMGYRLNPSGDSGEMNCLNEHLLPKLFSDVTWKNNQVSIAVAARRSNANHDRIDYKYYSLDPSLETVLVAVATMTGECRLQLLDVEGEPIATDRFNPMQVRDYCSLFLARTRGTKNAGRVQGGRTLLAVERNIEKVRVHHMFLAPYFNNGQIIPAFIISRTLTLSLDELKSIKEAKIELTFR